MKQHDLSVKQIKLIAGFGLGITFTAVVGTAIYFAASGGIKETGTSIKPNSSETTVEVNSETTVIEQKEGVKEKKESEIIKIKNDLWTLLEDKRTDDAAKEMLKVYKQVMFTEENELEKWHLDISAVATAAMVPYSQREELFRSLQLPRFKTVFSVYTSPLNVANLVSDPNSLIPIDVDGFNLIDETIVPKSEFNLDFIDSQVIENFKEQEMVEAFYIAELRYDSNDVIGVTAVLKNGDTVLIGYFSEEETPYQTADFWDKNRELFGSVPALNNN